ncbi:phage integrase N-terminal SAM-like domain-containing protein [uncultured Porticoccus sp.]|uniref:phage integrase N-terminal SAM-like domain-containing protein n=1 Tax=uncultured Porticoccus sp. TaxID=1256050 RepID=UPI0026393627|nr:phage integrase N-terminal SAM-like domain-containing protein [uncultured Porticoccus sp.]
MKEYMLVRRYSRRTVESYPRWIKRYILFHGKVRPERAVDRGVSVSPPGDCV